MKFFIPFISSIVLLFLSSVPANSASCLTDVTTLSAGGFIQITSADLPPGSHAVRLQAFDGTIFNFPTNITDVNAPEGTHTGTFRVQESVPPNGYQIQFDSLDNGSYDDPCTTATIIVTEAADPEDGDDEEGDFDPEGFNINQVFSPAKRFQSSEDFGLLASDIVLILTSIATAVAFIFIILAGIKFLTSSGDEKKLAAAQGQLTFALIGLAVVILAFIIIRVLQFFLGTNVPLT